MNSFIILVLNGGETMNYHGKTMLTCYKKIDKLVLQIENLIKKRVKDSFYDFSSTYTQAERVLKLNEVRLDLIELKLITKEALDSLSEVDKILISYKYFGVMPKDEDFDLKSRNYFRKQNKAIERFNSALKQKGYDEEWFLSKYFKIAFIAGAYQKTVLEEGKKHSKD